MSGDPAREASPGSGGAAADGPRTELYDLRVVVERIEGRSVCGLRPGDHIDLTRSSRLTIPEGRHFCLYALSAVLPLLPAKQRELAEGDWLASDCHVACPDPDERLIMRIDRVRRTSVPTEELT
ncbi:MAG: TIGR04076 family protein [Actinotalea sp.]|nr:TIGR04076 family protein [Actinotalea sp.]